MIRLLPLLTLLLLTLAAPAAAMVELPEVPVPVEGKPADRLLRGKHKRKLDKTVAHRDHVHIGMTKLGAAARTSFWSRGR